MKELKKKLALFWQPEWCGVHVLNKSLIRKRKRKM
jgi:hypothetical protein